MMKKNKAMSLTQWIETASEEEIDKTISTIRGRKFIYLAIYVVLTASFYIGMGGFNTNFFVSTGIFSGFFSGLACFCDNQLRIIKSRGRCTKGNPILVLFYIILGLYFMPVITVAVFAKSTDRLSLKLRKFMIGI